MPITAFDPGCGRGGQITYQVVNSVTELELVDVTIAIPLTTDPAAVPLRSYTLFLESAVVGEAVEIPITAVPPEVIGSMVFPDTVIVAAFELPSSKAVMEFPVVIPVIVLLFTVVPAPLKLTFIGTTVPAPVRNVANSVSINGLDRRASVCIDDTVKRRRCRSALMFEKLLL